MNTTTVMAWRNIWRNPRRTILTMLAIAFGAALLVFSVGFQLGQYDLMISNSVRVYQGLLQVQREGYQEEPKLRTSIENAIEVAKQVRDSSSFAGVSTRANGFALLSSEQRTYGVAITGVEPNHEKQVSTIPGLVKQGRYLDQITANELVIGASLAKNMRLKLGDEVTLLGTGRDGSVAAAILPVVGIFESGSRDLDRSLVQIPLQTFQEIFAMGTHAHSIVIFDERIDQVALFQQHISSLLPNEGLTTLRWDQVQPGLKEMIELDYSSGWFTYFILVAIITFSIMNTFLMAVLERTREFGIMLALGFKPFSIGKMLIIEAFFLTLIALLFGTALGLAVNTYFYFYGLSIEGMEEMAAMFNMPSVITPQISLKSITMGPLVILGFTLLAALYPALKIRRLEPVEAMRHV
ncbi:MAG: ABC transporter permease [Gammaproteobacteria bacterium]|nr:ABC transporter permease [Gammaproteobacteria bacterium]MDH5691995.1 ABC transporter permease [Gammaproteobacteria bacterium]